MGVCQSTDLYDIVKKFCIEKYYFFQMKERPNDERSVLWMLLRVTSFILNNIFLNYWHLWHRMVNNRKLAHLLNKKKLLCAKLLIKFILWISLVWHKRILYASSQKTIEGSNKFKFNLALPCAFALCFFKAINKTCISYHWFCVGASKLMRAPFSIT